MSDYLLTIVLPPPCKPGALMLAALPLLFIGLTLRKNANILLAPGAQAAGIWLVLLCFVAASGAILYRNLLWREQLSITKAGAPHAAGGQLVLACDDLMAIELRPPTRGDMSAAAKWAALGFGGERILLQTPQGGYMFGVQLSDSSALEMVRHIEAFCARSLLVPIDTTHNVVR